MVIVILHPGADKASDDTWLLNQKIDRNIVRMTTKDAALAHWAAGMITSGVYDCSFDADGHVTSILSLPIEARSTSPAPRLGDFPTVDADVLFPLLQDVRAWMAETLWPAFLRNLGENATPPQQEASLGMCSIATPALVQILNAEFPEGNWRANGGHPTVAYKKIAGRQFKKAFEDLDGGMWDYRRQAWDGHYWVEGTINGHEIIVDLTADQYGWQPITITAVDDTRYRASYRPSAIKKDTSGPTAMRTIAEEMLGYSGARRSLRRP